MSYSGQDMKPGALGEIQGVEQASILVLILPVTAPARGPHMDPGGSEKGRKARPRT